MVWGTRGWVLAPVSKCSFCVACWQCDGYPCTSDDLHTRVPLRTTQASRKGLVLLLPVDTLSAVVGVLVYIVRKKKAS